MTRFKDRVGKIYGKLTVIEYYGQDWNGITLWKCRCECNKISIVRGHNLQSRHTRSCGCQDNKARIERKSNRLHNIWRGMKSRCNSNWEYYEDIEVDPRWLDYQVFEDGSWMGWFSSHPTKCPHCGAREFNVICEKAGEGSKNEKRTASS